MIELGKSLVERNKIDEIINQLKKLDFLIGDIAEVGVYKGGTALEIAKNTLSNIFLFDTFEGMPYYSENIDKDWKLGSFNDVNYDQISKLFSNFDNVKIFKGVFPKDTSHYLENKSFKFVHLDVDNYQSYKECLEFFYEKMVQDGIIIFDDFNCDCCPGANKAIDEFFSDKKEKIITGVITYIIKQ